MAIFPRIAWQAWRHHAALARYRVRRLVILLSIIGNSITAASKSKAIICHPCSIIIASYLQQRTSATSLS
jgi:hypothetical protein